MFTLPNVADASENDPFAILNGEEYHNIFNVEINDSDQIKTLK